MRRARLALAVALVVGSIGLDGGAWWPVPGPRVALAQEAPATARAAAEAAFARAERAAKELRFQEALDAYEEAATRDPTAPIAPRARARVVDLRAHAEGGFAPLARLEAVRRDPVKNRDAATIAALDREARSFPDGRVRSEALLVVAQAYEHALDAKERAIDALEVIAQDRHSDPTTRALALSELITLYREKGDLPRALAAIEREPALLPSLTREVRADVQRGKVARVCLALLALLGLAALWGGVRGARRLGDVRALGPLVLRPGPLAFAFYVGAGGAVFVRFHGGEGDPMPFLGLGLGIAAVGILVRLWGLAEPRASRARTVTSAALGVVGVLAVAYLVLWRSGGAYLAPIGL